MPAAGGAVLMAVVGARGAEDVKLVNPPKSSAGAAAATGADWKEAKPEDAGCCCCGAGMAAAWKEVNPDAVGAANAVCC
jgi:hypothetical protein